MKPFFWITFHDRNAGSVEAANAHEAMIIAAQHGQPIEAKVIPYPASPALHVPSGCPCFCYQPQACAKAGECVPSRRGLSCTS